MVATDVLKNPSKYNAEYFKIRRQNKRWNIKKSVQKH
jgi:hypothetical protein